MKNIYLFILSLLFFCCQQSTDTDNLPDKGTSLVIIENMQYSGSAYLSSRKISEIDFKTITLELNDSTKIEILNDRFDTGTFPFNATSPENHIIFSLEFNHKPYYAEEGYLSLKTVNSDQIIGEFEVIVFDVTSSCLECPGTVKKTKGKFNAITI